MGEEKKDLTEEVEMLLEDKRLLMSNFENILSEKEQQIDTLQQSLTEAELALTNFEEEQLRSNRGLMQELEDERLQMRSDIDKAVKDKDDQMDLLRQALEESESKVIDALNKHNETVTEKNEQILALENQMKEVADQNSVAYDGEIQAAKIEHQQQMEKIEMLTKQLTLREDFHKETKVETAELLKKFEDASEKLTSKSEELKALVDEKQKGIDCLQQQLEESESKVVDALNKHNETVTKKNEQILALENRMKEVAVQNSVVNDGEMQAATIEHQQQMEKIEMLTKQVTLMEEAHKETKVETAGLLKKFEDASEKLALKSEEHKTLVGEKQKEIDCPQQQTQSANEKLVSAIELNRQENSKLEQQNELLECTHVEIQQLKLKLVHLEGELKVADENTDEFEKKIFTIQRKSEELESEKKSTDENCAQMKDVLQNKNEQIEKLKAT